MLLLVVFLSQSLHPALHSPLTHPMDDAKDTTMAIEKGIPARKEEDISEALLLTHFATSTSEENDSSPVPPEKKDVDQISARSWSPSASEEIVDIPGSRPEQPHPGPPTMIIVCCHGIWLGPGQWLIKDFQKGEESTFEKHVEEGLKIFLQYHKDGAKALLVFSGFVPFPLHLFLQGARSSKLTHSSGRTRKETRISEAESYLNLLLHSIWSRQATESEKKNLLPYIFTESFALDSFQNVSLPIRLYRETFDAAPESVIVISHAFKWRRFRECHFRNLKKGDEGCVFTFRGIDPGYMESNGIEDQRRAYEVKMGEHERGYMMWKEPGMKGIDEKRRERDVWDTMKTHSFWESAEQVVEREREEARDLMLRKTEEKREMARMEKDKMLKKMGEKKEVVRREMELATAHATTQSEVRSSGGC